MNETEFHILPTTHGYIKGRRCQTFYGDQYFSFEKIPFAKPPLGKLRFKAPQPPEKWDYILDCLECGPKPLQRTRATNELEGSEDCLYMNVYIKSLDSEKPLPVLVYIYGGVFQTGGAIREVLGPDYFMKEDVILAVISYRLGALGFMSFKSEKLDIPGNTGLKDQIAALKWLKANCFNFNGDPNNITIFGESSGGVSAHYLSITPKAENLFQKAILQSGCAYFPSTFEPLDEHPYRLAKLNGYEGSPDDEEAIYEFLLPLRDDQITLSVNTMEEKLAGRESGFGPTYEAFETDQGVLYDHPVNLLPNCWGNAIPMIIGGTTDEGTLFYHALKNDSRFTEIYKEKPEFILPKDLRALYSEAEAKELGLKVIEKYLGNNLEQSNRMEFLKLFGFTRFWIHFYRACQARLKFAASSSTYLYNFDFESEDFNFFRKRFLDAGISAVTHADDLCYLFCMKQAHQLDLDSREYKTIERMVGMWCAFARTGNPHCLAIAPAIWTPLQNASPLKCLNIGDSVELIDLPRSADLEYFYVLYENAEM